MLDEGIIRKTYKGPIDTATPVPIPFPFDNKTDVKLMKVDVNAVKTYPSYGTGYTVDDSSNVYLLNAIVDGETITVYRTSVMDQQRDFVEDGKYRVTEVEKAIDKLTMQNQEQNDAITRSLRTSLNTPTTFNAELPSPNAGKAILFDDTGNGLTTSTINFNDTIQQANNIMANAATSASNAATSAASAANSATTASNAVAGLDFTRLQSYKTYVVSNATNATPIVVTAVAHPFVTGDKVYISGVGGNTAANGTFTITKIGVDTFRLDGSVGNGTFTTNGTAIFYPIADDNLVSKVYVDNETSKKTVGEVISVICTSSYVPEGCLPCDGAEYSFSQFPTFVSNYLTSTPTKLLTCTYSEYATSIATYGQCAKFAVDTTNQKFKTPTIKDGSFIQQAMSDTELGKAYKAGLPNITGSLGNWGNSYMGTTETGAFKLNLNVGGNYGWNTGGGKSNSASFDASSSSSVYGNSTTVQPNAVALRYFVVVANGTLNSSQMDWSNYMSALAGKADITKVANLAMPSSSYIDLTLGASGTTYIAPSDGFVYIDKIASSSGQYMTLANNGASGSSWLGIQQTYVPSGGHCELYIPVKKNDIFQVNYSLGGTTTAFRFFYAEGSKP